SATASSSAPTRKEANPPPPRSAPRASPLRLAYGSAPQRRSRNTSGTNNTNKNHTEVGPLQTSKLGPLQVATLINNTTGTVEYLHHDQQGSTRLITGSTGKVEGKCSYSAYGTPTCEGTATTPLGWDGQYTSSDTGLVYLRAREYDPNTAQFLSRDPLTPITGEPYSYAEDNPLNETDPTGLSSHEGLGEGCAMGIVAHPRHCHKQVKKCSKGPNGSATASLKAPKRATKQQGKVSKASSAGPKANQARKTTHKQRTHAANPRKNGPSD
ncbi:MAG TPA: RHS repeat-associated core domain-containing protein, partial [Solirubrobacteraceae bacterium]|nr:RHS repeat-associated core domain-containing protein [Solirubrobacteraceae bacterium]